MFGPALGQSLTGFKYLHQDRWETEINGESNQEGLWGFFPFLAISTFEEWGFSISDFSRIP